MAFTLAHCGAWPWPCRISKAVSRHTSWRVLDQIQIKRAIKNPFEIKALKCSHFTHWREHRVISTTFICIININCDDSEVKLGYKQLPFKFVTRCKWAFIISINDLIWTPTFHVKGTTEMIRKLFGRIWAHVDGAVGMERRAILKFTRRLD